ncbi:zinc-binding dehydrogenase [Conexibacter sp. DBS9H8]|uniref:zinc-binding dehydrogenase n=1 Tax=Conexibacter sp. DBS9H8 TaxID=2937801 RepID=UPI003531401E
MRAAYLERFDAEDPAAAVTVGERPTPDPPAGWTVVTVRGASINHHDVWSARGLCIREEALPMILGTDAAGDDADGNAVIIHGVINAENWLGPQELDPQLSLLSERHQGALAEQVVVPRANLVPKPQELSFAEASCLPTAWLTAYRMLFVQAALKPGETVLIQGAAGGLASAAIMLANAAGLIVWVTGRSEEKREYARSLGADAAFEPGARLPARVDAVLDSVGAKTAEHSLYSVRKGGTVVVAGGTSGLAATYDLGRLFSNNVRIQGSTMGTRDELIKLLALMVKTGIRPPISDTLSLDDVPVGIARMSSGDVRGKLVVSL